MMGAQDSLLKAVLVDVIPSEKRSTAFGVFDTGFGIAWFAGSAIMGWAYVSIQLTRSNQVPDLISVDFMLRKKTSAGLGEIKPPPGSWASIVVTRPSQPVPSHHPKLPNELSTCPDRGIAGQVDMLVATFKSGRGTKRSASAFYGKR